MEKMIKHQELAHKNHEALLRNLERQIGQLSKQIVAKRAPNALPNDTIPNPKEGCKAIQLRSGRTLVNDKETNKRPAENDEASSKEEVTLKEKDQEKLREKEEQPQALKKGKQVMEEQSQEQRKIVKTYTPPLLYTQRLHKELKDQQFPKFLEVFKKLEINIPLAEALEQMPLYAKFLNELINKKRSWNKKETVILTQECSAVIQRGLPPKLKDPGSFILSCTIGNKTLDKALCDLGASINLVPLSLMKQFAIEELRPTRMSLQMADRSLKIPNGVVENLLVKVEKFIFSADFVILDMEEERHNSIILGRPFLAIARAIIDVEKGEMTLRVHDKKMIINVFKSMQYPPEKEKHMRVEMVEEVERGLLENNNQEEQEVETEVEQDFIEEEVVKISSEVKTEEKPKQELKPLPPHLKYVFLGEAEALPAPWFDDIANYKVGRKISQEFTKQQVKKLLNEAKKFLWDEPFLFRRCPDRMIRKCVPESEMRDIL
ncbi:uncharacterized protein LOC107640833 [Arachis ipaensis]|uniref:uncharacterized protein LOC107640833 n=1 Tax=Arachis ipaensis TaxID=130454 RepID=UPI0007AFA8FD|nr:uncharacterized protein LOC107640833 [Arachis ipaensis]